MTFIVRRLVAVLEVEKPQTGTVLAKFRVEILRGKKEYSFTYDIHLVNCGAMVPCYVSSPSARAAAMVCYGRMFRWLQSNAPDQFKVIKEFRLWFSKSVLAQIKKNI